MNIVAMGGGTGLAALLQGLKRYVREGSLSSGRRLGKAEPTGEATPLISQLSAVVGVSDDGGSSGRLRREFRVLPPGDIRNCLVALSEDATLLSRLFQFRFTSGRGLKGHSFGNLFLTALTGVMGDFQDAVSASGEVLAIRGRIFPSTMSDATLEAVLEDGTIIKGETHISRSHCPISRIRLVPAQCRPLPQTLEAIREADVITIGPGSLYTSLIPNLLVRGVAREMAGCRAARIYIGNLMTQPGETTLYSASDHVRAIYDHCGFPIFDYALFNTKLPSHSLRKQYLAQRSKPVEVDEEKLERLGVRLVKADLLSEDREARSGKRKLRHHSDRLAKAVLDIGLRHQGTVPKPIEFATGERSGSTRLVAS